MSDVGTGKREFASKGVILGFCLFFSFFLIPLASSKHGGCRELSAMQHRERMPVVSVFSVRAESASLLEPTFFNYPSSSTIKTRVFLQPAASSALKFRLAFSWSNRHRLRCSEYEIDIHVLSSLLLHISNRSSGFIHGLSCVYSCLISLSESEWEREKQDGME
jgi:hypothetical protein